MVCYKSCFSYGGGECGCDSVKYPGGLEFEEDASGELISFLSFFTFKIQ